MPSISIGSARVLSMFVVAFLGVMVQILTAPFGLPEPPPDSLTHGWDRFYTPLTQEAGFLGALAGAFAVALLQYKEEVHEDGFPIPLTPLCVVLYLSLPAILPAQHAAGAYFLLAIQFGILVSIMLDTQPQMP